MDDGAAVKTLIDRRLSGARRGLSPPRKRRACGFCLSILAAMVKIHQGFQSLSNADFCFGYNGPHARGIVLPQGDASPSKMGARIATQVRAVAV